MRVRLTTDLACTPDAAWDWVQRPRLLRHVAWPLVSFVAVEPAAWPERWAPGDYHVRMRIFGVLPMGAQRIRISHPPCAPARCLRDDGQGTLARTWDHRITVEAAPDGGTRYTDEVEVKAGVLTPMVWAFAQLFYRWRQHRWRRLASANFAALSAPS
jgi:hypothetical protein